MTIELLKTSQPAELLDKLYGKQDYYWYLKSEQFRRVFIRPLATVVNDLNLPCLDVACGEGWLADYVTVPYTGIDGSTTAIETARSRHSSCGFIVCRIESPELLSDSFGTIVFGGILKPLVKPQCYVLFLELYLRFNPKYLVIYDLLNLEESTISRRFSLVDRLQGSVDMVGIPRVKKHRKILVYSCSS